jgi:hypothetical protein
LQYLGIVDILVELAGYSTLVGVGISFLFLFVSFQHENHHPTFKIFIGSLMGAVLIAITIIALLVAVDGLGILAGFNLTGLLNMFLVWGLTWNIPFTLWSTDNSGVGGVERVHFTMLFLMLPNPLQDKVSL